VNKWTRPFEGSLASAPPAARAVAPKAHHYFAFLSYSHEDTADADWLHQELEKFRVPSSLAGKLTANGVVPKRLTPIFRDRHELAAAHDLNEEIRTALAFSRCLIVLCSPAAARSKWTNAEIDTFKRLHPDGCIIAAVIAGEPLASDIPGREVEECFPPALVAKYNRRGKPTGKKAEPLAADLREGKGGRRVGFLKIVAGILGVGLDDLVQRDHLRRQRRLAMISSGSIAGMIVASALAVTAIQARDAARDQRRQAEALVEYMVGDLKDKLEPIGRLDVLDGVGARVLAYYSKQDASELSDSALLQRSQALSLMAQVANSRGDYDGSVRLYREAMAGTAEAIKRNPRDPQALFDHAQNVFYIGEIAHEGGQFKAAEASMREYQRLALRMMALDPDNMKWRMEKQYADFNLGVSLMDQRRFPEAVTQFSEALKTIEAIATADPNNKEYQDGLAESLTWLGDAERATGDYRGAIAARKRNLAQLSRMFARTGDVNYQQRLIPAHRMLGLLYAEQGQTDLAKQELQVAVEQANRLIPKEPDNTLWLEYASSARLILAKQLLSSGDRSEASAQANAGCQTVNGLLSRNQLKPQWQVEFVVCLQIQAKLKLSGQDRAAAMKVAQEAIARSKSVHSGDPVADAYLVASSYRLAGDVQRALDNNAAARSAWQMALESMPSGAAEPDQLAERASVLARLGRTAEAETLHSKLRSMGYRQAE